MEGGSNVDGDESGGTSPSRQGAGAGILVPRSLMAMAAEIGIASGEKGSGIRVSATRCKYMRRGVTRGGAGAPGAPLARPGVGPRQVAAWAPCGPPLVALLRIFVILLENTLRRFSGNLEVFFFSNSASTFYR